MNGKDQMVKNARDHVIKKAKDLVTLPQSNSICTDDAWGLMQQVAVSLSQLDRAVSHLDQLLEYLNELEKENEQE